MRSRAAVALGVGGALAAHWAPTPAALSPTAARLLRLRTTFPSERGVLLTFDDGPHPQGTPAVLSALDDAHAPAMFFVSGEQAARYGGLTAEIVAAGHEIGVHGFRHQTRRQWTRRLLVDDTKRALDAISSATATTPRFYRPPHGVFSLTGLRVIRQLRLAPMLWSKWGRDWEYRATSSTIARRATDGVKAGDVVLLHDADHYGAPSSWRETAGSLAPMLERVAAVGLEPASVRADLDVGFALTL